MENKDANFKKVDLGDLDSKSELMDVHQRAEEDAFRNEFSNPNRDTSTYAQEVKNDAEVEDAADLLPGADESEVVVDGATPKLGEDGNPIDPAQKVAELTTDLFDEALTKEETEELDLLNKKLGTEFKDMKSLKESFKKESGVDEEEQKIAQTENLSNYLKQVSSGSDEELIYQDVMAAYRQEGKDPNDPEVQEAIKEEADGIIDSPAFKITARNLKRTIEANVEKMDATVKAYKDGKQQTAAQKEQERKEKLQGATQKFFQQGKFYGVDVPQEQYLKAYKKASDKTLINELSQNPELLLEMQLLYDNRENIAKVNGSPSYSAGVKATFDAIKGQKPEHTDPVVTNKKVESGIDSYIADWVK